MQHRKRNVKTKPTTKPILQREITDETHAGIGKPIESCGHLELAEDL